MSLLIYNIKQLVFGEEKPKQVYKGLEMSHLPCIENAWCLIDISGRFADFGRMQDCPPLNSATEIIDASERLLWPAWCDSHTHAVFAASRQDEFEQRLAGLTYAEIAAKGGGILNSAQRLAALSEAQLLENSLPRVQQCIAQGTGAIEIKSGYGLNTQNELKMLRVARKIGEILPIFVRTTFLGAHALPPTHSREGYIDLIIEEMLPAIAEAQLADYVDVFCETGYFTVAEMERILIAARTYNLPAKVHVNQFTSLGAIAAAVNLGAVSVDHLEVMTEADFVALQGATTLPVALPGCSLFLDIPYTPGRRLIDAGNALVLASDFNPGSSPSSNMSLVVALACSQMKILPAESIIAATQNGAAAMGLSNVCGSIARGKWANFWLSTPMESFVSLPYAFGDNFVDKVFFKGKMV